MLEISNLTLPLDHTEEDLLFKVSKKLHLSPKEIQIISITKKSIDARDKHNICFVYSIACTVADEPKYVRLSGVSLKKEYVYPDSIGLPDLEAGSISRPIIVGSGPAGLFAALILAQNNRKPILIEQGKKIEDRQRDVDLFWKEGILNPQSNALFGEGGAGTFSDGKINTGVKDSRISKVILEFLEAGAPSTIAYSNKPHIGTDYLSVMVRNMRQKIIDLGGEVWFQTKLTNLVVEKNNIVGIEILTSDQQVQILKAKQVVLAIGHSARDTVKMLFANQVAMEAKAFSVGARIEHPREWINRSQYGKFYNHPALGAADYKLASKTKSGRGVYTFCMCPGGSVVACSTQENTIVTNGMSYYNRDLPNSNSALLVSVGPEDFGYHPLDGILFQQKLERNAFMAGGGKYFAPAQLVGDFLQSSTSRQKGDVEPSYSPGITWTDLSLCLDSFIVEGMREGIRRMDEKLKGFAMSDAILTGVETRSSSPVRILRDKFYQSNIRGLLPCGEGCGYAGGIMSAALDGIKCAEAILNVR